MAAIAQNQIPRQKGIPRSPRYDICRAAARQVMHQGGVNWLPVDPRPLFRAIGGLLLTEAQVSRLTGLADPLLMQLAGADARTVQRRDTDMPITIFREDKLNARIRWSLAHELGHIALGHLTKYEFTRLGAPTVGQASALEREADAFACELLAPPGLLRAMGVKWAEDVALVCDLSQEAAGYRERDLATGVVMAAAKAMEQWYQEHFAEFLVPVAVCARPDDIGPLHRMAIHRSEVSHVWQRPEQVRADANGRFVECPRCGFSGFSKDASYCRVCGTHLHNVCTNGPMLPAESTCARLNPPDAMYCEWCGHETLLMAQGLVSQPKEWAMMRETPAAEVATGTDGLLRL